MSTVSNIVYLALMVLFLLVQVLVYFWGHDSKKATRAVGKWSLYF